MKGLHSGRHQLWLVQQYMGNFGGQDAARCVHVCLSLLGVLLDLCADGLLHASICCCHDCVRGDDLQCLVNCRRCWQGWVVLVWQGDDVELPSMKPHSVLAGLWLQPFWQAVCCLNE